jgi:hypothetical protein
VSQARQRSANEQFLELGLMLLEDDPLIPWHVQPRHLTSSLMTQLCLESRRRSGYPLHARTLMRLQAWLEALAEGDLVVDYDPDNGFRLVPRDAASDHDIIRRPH